MRVMRKVRNFRVGECWVKLGDPIGPGSGPMRSFCVCVAWGLDPCATGSVRVWSLACVHLPGRPGGSSGGLGGRPGFLSPGGVYLVRALYVGRQPLRAGPRASSLG